MVLIAGMLAGCVEDLGSRFSGRWGPNPAIQPADFDAVAQNQYTVLSYLARATGRGGLVTQDGVLLAGAPQDWYEVAQWGFNVGRQDCEIYLATLFRMNREKGRNDSLMTAISTAAALAVAATTTSQKPLSILAAVFGLSVAANDAIYDSYLFSQAAPGLVFKKVNDLEEEFRSKVTPADVTSPSSAYNAIQTYYHICLPHAIEGVLLQKIADSGPVTPGKPTDKPPLVAAPAAVQLQRFRQNSGSANPALRAPELR
jgi:hypothetical protein